MKKIPKYISALSTTELLTILANKLSYAGGNNKKSEVILGLIHQCVIPRASLERLVHESGTL